MSCRIIKAGILLAVALTLAALPSSLAQDRGNTLSFSVMDNRRLIERELGSELLLRVQKVCNSDVATGWEVSVIHKPLNEKSMNLLYHSVPWHGPYPSQIEAWQVEQNYFPNRRELEVSSFPYTLLIELIDPKIAGNGPAASFVSGYVKISWRRTSKPNPPPAAIPQPQQHPGL